MPPTKQELSLLIYPLVPESVQHNHRILSQTHSLTAFLLGLSAGILGLRSANGFLFYLISTILVSGLFHILLVGGRAGGAGAFFPGSSGGEIEGIGDRGLLSPPSSPTQNRVATGTGTDRSSEVVAKAEIVVKRKGAWKDVWFGGGVMGEALSGFVLGWAGVGGVLR